MIVLVTHALFLNNKDVYGPAHAVSIFLNKTGRDHIFIKHRAEGQCLSKIEFYKGGKLQQTKNKGTTTALPFIFRYFLELYISIKTAYLIPDKCELFIGVDPLNALAGNILKIMGKVNTTVFLSADFSLKRFENVFLSNIYILLDKAAMFWSGQTWSVSKRIVDYRQKQGITENKNKILPNAPFFEDIKRHPYKKIHKHDLVLVSALNRGIVPFELIIDVVCELRKTIKDIHLHIIGSGSEEKKLKNYVTAKHAEQFIKFYGVLTHANMFTILTKSSIGIAVYEKTDKKHLRYFSDSMRTRDYLASGLPVFFSGSSAVGSEILSREAGRVVSLEKEAMVDSLKEVLTNPTLYQKLRINALKLAKEYDTFNLLTKYFTLLKK